MIIDLYQSRGGGGVLKTFIFDSGFVGACVALLSAFGVIAVSGGSVTPVVGLFIAGAITCGSAVTRWFAAHKLRKLDDVLRSAPIGIALTRNGRFDLVSNGWARLLGYPVDEIMALAPEKLLAEGDRRVKLTEQLVQTFASGQNFVDELELRRRDGSSFWGRIQANLIDAANPKGGTVWLLTDVTHERDARSRLSWMATHDTLTGLLNRNAFETLVADRLAHRPMSQPAALLYLDLDHFKDINDTWGHAAGDQVLVEVAGRMVQGVRSSDIVARLGGDEFAVLLLGCDLPCAARIAEQLRLKVDRQPCDWQGQTLKISVSLGVISIDDHRVLDVPAAMQVADAALYQAKREGRNKVSVSSFGSFDESS